ncbi:Kinesin-like protein KIP2 [Cucumispora dikerogammari]|nr:Kinesin-like protein KIP2 [Cucumispora dikerogammari]
MGEKIKVFIKIRDDLKNEIWKTNDNLLKLKVSNGEEIIYRHFNNVFHKVTAKEIFDIYLNESFTNLVNLKKSSTIFAYGQTGTGKTHFMMGSICEKSKNNDDYVDDYNIDVETQKIEPCLSDNYLVIDRADTLKNTDKVDIDPPNETDDIICPMVWVNNSDTASLSQLNTNESHKLDLGIIKLYLKNIFAQQKQNNYKVFVSFLEIYNENLIDLLTPENEPKFYSNTQNELKIKDLETKMIETYESALLLLSSAEKRRRTEKTDYNMRSSRSHTIFKIELVKGNLKQSVSLIDLAGSEKGSNDLCRRREGSFINRSLLALSSLIRGLSTTSSNNTSLQMRAAFDNSDNIPLDNNPTNKNNNHINYRNSKLTRVLKSSLTAEVDLFAFCMIKPTLKSKIESLSTISFASQLVDIKMNYSPTKIETETKTDCKCLELSTVQLEYDNILNNYNEMQRIYDNIKLENENTLENYKLLNEKYKNLFSNYNLKTSECELLKKRIINLENMIYKVNETFPNSRLKDVFLIEKGLFNLKMEDLINTDVIYDKKVFDI